MTVIELIGDPEDYLTELTSYWESLGLDTELLSNFSISSNGTTRWGQVGEEYIIHGITDSRGRMTINVLVPDDEADLWCVPLTSGATSEHVASRGTLTLPTINNVAIVTSKTPISNISGHSKPPVDLETPDAPVPPAWVQPIGAHDAYSIGVLTTHNGSVWTSLVDANVWEPGVSSWREATSGIPAWVQPTGAHDAYGLGDQVTHNGSTWTSDYNANVWEPGVFGWTVDE